MLAQITIYCLLVKNLHITKLTLIYSVWLLWQNVYTCVEKMYKFQTEGNLGSNHMIFLDGAMICLVVEIHSGEFSIRPYDLSANIIILDDVGQALNMATWCSAMERVGVTAHLVTCWPCIWGSLTSIIRIHTFKRAQFSVLCPSPGEVETEGLLRFIDLPVQLKLVIEVASKSKIIIIIK